MRKSKAKSRSSSVKPGAKKSSTGSQSQPKGNSVKSIELGALLFKETDLIVTEVIEEPVEVSSTPALPPVPEGTPGGGLRLGAGVNVVDLPNIGKVLEIPEGLWARRYPYCVPPRPVCEPPPPPLCQPPPVSEPTPYVEIPIPSGRPKIQIIPQPEPICDPSKYPCCPVLDKELYLDPDPGTWAQTESEPFEETRPPTPQLILDEGKRKKSSICGSDSEEEFEEIVKPPSPAVMHTSPSVLVRPGEFIYHVNVLGQNGVLEVDRLDDNHRIPNCRLRELEMETEFMNLFPDGFLSANCCDDTFLLESSYYNIWRVG